MIGRICGKYFLRVWNCVLLLDVQFIYILCIDRGSLWNVSSSLIPNFAIWIDLSSGVQEAEMDDLCGFDSCSPFCDMGRQASSITYSGTFSLAAISWQRSFIICLMLVMCSEL